MSTQSSNHPIVFYDISTRPPVSQTCCSPNPWKTRFALNFKALPYTTTWVALPDIAKVRSSLAVAPCRKFADGSDFFTLPIVSDPATNASVGDSFDIAAYLQRTYPDAGAGDLFPAQTSLDYVVEQSMAFLVPLSACRDEGEYAEYARFNINVDAAFTAHVQLTTGGFPFDPASEADVKALFVKRAGVKSWDDFALVGEARTKMMESFRKTLGGLAKLFEREAGGPFLRGEMACYADMIVGAWLRMMHATLPEEEWEQVRGWHGGVFGKLHDGLEAYAEVK